jgi:hypothetical protein
MPVGADRRHKRYQGWQCVRFRSARASYVVEKPGDKADHLQEDILINLKSTFVYLQPFDLDGDSPEGLSVHKDVTRPVYAELPPARRFLTKSEFRQNLK